jgi:hypothetical protein
MKRNPSSKRKKNFIKMVNSKKSLLINQQLQVRPIEENSSMGACMVLGTTIEQTRNYGIQVSFTMVKNKVLDLFTLKLES